MPDDTPPPPSPSPSTPTPARCRRSSPMRAARHALRQRARRTPSSTSPSTARASATCCARSRCASREIALKAAFKPLTDAIGGALSPALLSGVAFANGGVIRAGLPVPFAERRRHRQPHHLPARRRPHRPRRRARRRGHPAARPRPRRPPRRARRRWRRHQRHLQRHHARRRQLPPLRDPARRPARPRRGAGPPQPVRAAGVSGSVGSSECSSHCRETSRLAHCTTAYCPLTPCFHDTRFPTAISRAAHGGPERRTDVVVLGSGAEERNARWADSRRSYNAGYGVKSLDDLHAVIAFFEERRGRLHGFRWRDPTDCKSCPPEGTPTALDQDDRHRRRRHRRLPAHQDLRRRLQSLDPRHHEARRRHRARRRRRRDPDARHRTTPIDHTTGVVTFLPGHIPAAGAAVTAGFEFDVPVRFDTDQLEINLQGFRHGAIPSHPHRRDQACDLWSSRPRP